MKRFPIILVADNIRSLENVGSLFRIADAINAEKLVLIGITGCPDLGDKDTRRPWLRYKQTAQIKKTALSGLETVPFEYYPTTAQAIDALVQEKIQLICIEQTSNAVAYNGDYDIHFPCALVFGNEKDGVTAEFINAADLVLELPQYGAGKSLNVSVSAGIVSYQILTRYLENSRL